MTYLTIGERKHLLARLLALGVDATDWRIVAEAIGASLGSPEAAKADARRHGGYVFGRSDDTGEVGTSRVCAHGQPIGWSCVGCAKDAGGVGTAPAGPATDTKYRAVCDHCGSRVWFPSAMVPEEVRLIVDAEEAESRATSEARARAAFAR